MLYCCWVHLLILLITTCCCSRRAFYTPSCVLGKLRVIGRLVLDAGQVHPGNCSYSDQLFGMVIEPPGSWPRGK